MTDDELIAQVKRGEVSEQFYARYERRQQATRRDAGDVLTDLLGNAGARLANRARRTVQFETQAELQKTIERMPEAAREKFARDVLRFRG